MVTAGSGSSDARAPRPGRRIDEALYLALVALLPLHTVYFRAWIAWKPWLVLLVVLAGTQVWQGVRARSSPWERTLTIPIAVFLLAMAASWPGGSDSRFARLFLALVIGALLLLVSRRMLSRQGMLDRVLRAVYWSAAAMAATAVLLSMVAVGVFGAGAADSIADLPLIERVVKVAYLREGFVGLTNWHQDPGYAAAWMNLWAAIAFLAVRRGLGSGRVAIDALVVGGLWLGVFMTLSRTGLLGMGVGIVTVLWTERREIRPALLLAAVSAAAAVALAGTVWLLDPPDIGGDIGEAVEFRIRQGFSLGPGDSGGEAPGVLDLEYRGEVWPIYWDYFLDDPLRGAGLGTGWAAEGVQEPHNLLLQLIGETGVVGLAGFVVLFVAIVRSARNRIGVAALIVALSGSITQTVLFEATWWFAAALALAPRSPPILTEA
ncbi:MAG TPA: O-antigen ligase family protein [Acidimicrobiia bacterium]|nr:O-antigen ligase family protein [Acidimicrobiia bacterium]